MSNTQPTDLADTKPDDVSIKPVAFQSDKRRRGILLSYWIVILLGIPLWWITTSITRLPLPEARVKSLQEKQVSELYACIYN